jgi:hypothetical protein
MTIEIDEGKIEKLKIFFDSKPDEVAYEFCRENNLDFNALKFLTQEIKCVLANGLQEKNKMSLMEEGIKEVNESQELVSDERKINRNPLSNNANNIDKMPDNLNPIKSLNKSESKKKMNSVFFLTSENDVKNTNFENNKLDNAFNNNNKQLSLLITTINNNNNCSTVGFLKRFERHAIHCYGHYCHCCHYGHCVFCDN